MGLLADAVKLSIDACVKVKQVWTKKEREQKVKDATVEAVKVATDLRKLVIMGAGPNHQEVKKLVKKWMQLVAVGAVVDESDEVWVLRSMEPTSSVGSGGMGGGGSAGHLRTPATKKAASAPVKKTAAKKHAAKKTAAKRAAAKKPAAKKVVAKKPTSNKVVAKKAAHPAMKPAAKKSAARKPPAFFAGAKV